MKVAAAVLAVTGAALCAFGWWGTFTVAGSSRFDEMDGLIPFFAGCAGLFVLVAATIVALIGWRLSVRDARASR